MSDTQDVRPVAPKDEPLDYPAGVLGWLVIAAGIAAGIAIGIAAGHAAYHLLCHVWGSEVVVYGICYTFDGTPLNCQPGGASPGRAVTVEPGNHVLKFGCHSECFPRETPYVYQKVPMFGDYPIVLLVGIIVGVIAAVIAGLLCLYGLEVVTGWGERQRASRGDG